MGTCQSIEEQNGGAQQQEKRTTRQRTNTQNRRNNSNIQSFVRVGSKVLQQSDDHHLLEVGRASTYDHVHNFVGISIEQTSNNNGRREPCGVIGLRNLGNTCFLNSALQCLSNTIPLTDYFLGYDYRKEINYANILGTKGRLVYAYTQLMKQMWLSSSTSIDPSPFFQPLIQFAPDFNDGQQHDSQELLSFLLDGIHEDLNRVQKKQPYSEDKDGDGSNDEGGAVIAWQNYLLRNRSIVVDLFQGQLRNTMVCGTCGFRKVKFEPFMYLSLPISFATKTLDDCLELFCEKEHLKGENQWFCSGCGTHVDATKKLDLWMLPPILIIHLKRFNHRGDKIETPIHYQETNWNLSGSVKSKSGLYPMFDLYAVSNHAGGLNGGHYTAMVKNRFDDQWYEANDSSTRKIHKEQMGNPKAYCLFYNRVETKEGRKRSDPKVMRQSIDRPELWPHMQLTNDFASFRRSTVVTDMPVKEAQVDAEMSPTIFET